MTYITTQVTVNRDGRTLKIEGYILCANSKPSVIFNYDIPNKTFDLKEFSERLTQEDLRKSVKSYLKKTEVHEQKGHLIYF